MRRHSRPAPLRIRLGPTLSQEPDPMSTTQPEPTPDPEPTVVAPSPVVVGSTFNMRRLWLTSLAAGLIAGVAAWLGGESIRGVFQPVETTAMGALADAEARAVLAGYH